tara:strand:+ start:590 stop:718 length:129 start_codon:yes stop_codon:yes gene_type:complete
MNAKRLRNKIARPQKVLQQNPGERAGPKIKMRFFIGNHNKIL